MNFTKATILISSLALSATAKNIENPFNFRSYTQYVVAEFKDTTDANNAELVVSKFPNGAEISWGTRWDDSDWRHISKAEMLEQIGHKATFFLNENNKFLCEIPKLLSRGHAIGNHTKAHPFVIEYDSNNMFEEVMENRIILESASNYPIVSFVIPFNWVSTIDGGQRVLMGEILRDTDHYMSSDYDVPDAVKDGFPMFSIHSRANDSSPQKELFEKTFATAKEKAKLGELNSRIIFGIHSWCDKNGEKTQEEFLSEAINENKDFFYTNDNEFGSYVYSRNFANVKKLSVKGNKAIYKITRFYPSDIGDDIPLSISFSSSPSKIYSTVDLKSKSFNKVTKNDKGFYTLNHDTSIPTLGEIGRINDKESKSEKFPNVQAFLDFIDKDATLILNLKFTSGEPQDIIITPYYDKTHPIVFKTQTDVKYKLVNKIKNNDKSISPYDENAFFAVKVEWTENSKINRLWVTKHYKPTTKKSIDKLDSFRDTFLALGPFDKNKFVESDWINASKDPNSVLSNIGTALNEEWASRADKKRGRLSVYSFIPWEIDKNYLNTFKDLVNNQQAICLFAVDLITDEVGTYSLILPKEKYESTDIYLNGTKYSFKGRRFDIPLNKGENRLIINATIMRFAHQAYSMTMAICKDGDFSKCVKAKKPETPRKPEIFESKNLSATFTKDGELKTASVKDFVFLCGFSPFVNPEIIDKGKISTESINPKFIIDKDNLKIVGKKRILKSEDGTPLICINQNIFVTPDKLTYEWEADFLSDVSWKKSLFESTLGFPFKDMIGAKIEYQYRNEQKELVIDKDYNPKHNLNEFLNPTFHFKDYSIQYITEGCTFGQMFDRRQWNNDSFTTKFFPKGQPIWGAHIKDNKGKKYSWKLTIQPVE